MGKSLLSLFIEFIVEILFLPYYYFPNLVCNYYAFRSYKGIKKVLIYLFLPIINLLAPVISLSINMALRNIGEDEPKAKTKEDIIEDELIDEIIIDNLEKPQKPMLEDYFLTDELIQRLEQFQSVTKVIFYITYILPALISAYLLNYYGIVKSTIQILIATAILWIILISIIASIYKLICSSWYLTQFSSELLKSNKELTKIKLNIDKYEYDKNIYNKKVKLIERAIMRKTWDYWFSKDGEEFEQAVAHLFLDLGYIVYTTPKKGDHGVDLLIEKNNEKAIIQCKSYKQTIGPKIVRELYGVLLDIGVDKAILAAPRGFTSAVYEFAKNKPIELWDINDLTKSTYKFDNYIDYQLANAKSLNDVKKYIKNKTGVRV